ncbi:Oidioi.mRNA.OKI2018_I69.XSR.g15039.t1.cds [Oikopleura dioica]|uniref:Oidioi.mRNA.OKI2018_I69.XSR.g15039.t1.cds n=1 Tax=Oikopleura dioica TaxID=34765 RepID=A0ABN7SBK7_OIKDI|nr:Oidioi.mRNA.OKI2018_I69.XSR.g15039.t1.cds [Oikopleura dioica]
MKFGKVIDVREANQKKDYLVVLKGIDNPSWVPESEFTSQRVTLNGGTVCTNVVYYARKADLKVHIANKHNRNDYPTYMRHLQKWIHLEERFKET